MRRFAQSTSRRPGQKVLAVAALVCASLSAVACDRGSGPVDDTFILQGELLYQGSATHELVSMDEGIVRLEVVGLRPRLIAASVGSNIVIGLGIGRPGNEGCQTSFRSNARVGSVYSIGLEEATEYCVLIFDPGTLPEDASIEYTVTVSPG